MNGVRSDPPAFVRILRQAVSEQYRPKFKH
jgi:hypothetical protein